MKELSGLSMGETFFFILLAYALGMIIGIVAYTQLSIRAIDVYRGKTTLEITYRDSVAVDSVVIYKMK